jgi:PKD repeat protein
MDKIFTKSLISVLLFYLLTINAAFSQTVALRSFISGTYGQGSTISVPFRITGCFGSTNQFRLYLSDPTGNFTAKTLIGTYTGFYASFVNGVIPTGTPAGALYKVRVETTTPIITTIAESAVFTISPLPGTVAATTSASVNSVTYPDVFGECLGSSGQSYPFINKSTANAVPVAATANFYNELTQADEGTFVLNKNFAANAANYTVTVSADNAGIIGTRSYLLMNNVINNSFGASGSTTVCLSGANSLTYNVDVSSPNGIQNNFPGMTYEVSWGDGGPKSTYTLCDIINGGGKISHPYTKSSCGNLVNGQPNVFQVDLQPVSPFCGKVVTQVTGYAKVLAPPQNKFTMDASACVGTPVTINNNSVPGQDPNSTSLDCENINGRYTWLVDGNPVVTDYDISKPFVYTFTTTGTHRVTLHLQNSNGLCAANDLEQTVCVQDPPTAAFTLPSTTICAGSTLAPVNTSVNPSSCAVIPYEWIVTGPAAVGYTGGTNSSSSNPQFVFNTPGIYEVSLNILALNCGTITSAPRTVVVNTIPIASLSPDALVCGSGITFTFDTYPGVTRSILANTQQQLPTTYVWTVTGGDFIFAGGTNANSRFPQITFKDYAAYTVKVVHTNNCGTAEDSQLITFKPSPVVSAGIDQIICDGGQATLAGTISGASTSQQWVGGTGTFIPNRTTLNATYIPSAAEIAAGQALLTLRVTTTLAAPCNTIDDDVVIAITRKDNITSPATRSVCTDENFTYNITSANAATTFTWTAALTSGTATGFSTTGNGNTINNAISNNTTADAVVTYTITPVTNGCTGNPFALKVTVKPLPQSSAAVANPLICSNQPAGITLTSDIVGVVYTWTSTASAGITGNTNQTVPTGNASIQDLLINNRTAVGTVTYTITPLNGTCGVAPITATVTVQPAPVTSVPGADEQICNSPVYTLQGNNPAPGTGKWTLVSGQAGVTFSDDTKPNAVVSGLLPGNVYQFKWAITALPACPPSSNVVTITNAAETIGGTLAGTATVCSGINAGAVTLTGQVGNVLRWEYSENGTIWLPIANSTTTLNYLNITETTQYRAVVQNSVCSIKISTVATINVNPPAVIAIAGADVALCNTETALLSGNNPAPFAGTWTQTGGPAVTIVNPTSHQTQVTGMASGNVYRFRWTIKGLPPCTDSSDEIVVTDNNDVTASFTANKATGCGPQAVTFTNTSSVITGTSFVWDFGDGSPQSAEVNPQHTFLPRPDGKEAVYTVSLNIVNNCVPRPAVTTIVKVSPPAPVSAILPDNLNGCGAFVLNVQNVSPGNNSHYDFYLYRGSTLVQHIARVEKESVAFNAITTTVTRTYILYMVTTDLCGTKTKSIEIPITISPANFAPQMFIKNSINKGCAPLNVMFVNNSSGGDTFSYNIYDVNNNLIESVTAGKSDFPYVFTTPGTYYVSLTGADYCTTLESTPKLKVDVYPAPLPDFEADVTTGCRSIKVQFANFTQKDGNTPPASLIYDWDFGDGRHETAYTPSAHVYSYENSPYTVKLTVTNLATGCTNTIVKNDLIFINSPPNVRFTAKPDTVTTIPNYHFAFVDQTADNLVSWQWTFGDGSSSTSQNPEHTYPDTGSYKVTLKVINTMGCDSTITHKVQVKGVPGQLYLPNAFTPNGLSNELRTFTTKGSGILKWNLQVFNNWGQLVWQTNKLDSKGEPVDSWDGTYKGAPAPQGVYIWQASATFINGTEWKGMSYNNSLPKRSGVIHLIR